MTSGRHIQLKFQAWAKRNNIPLQGSKGKRGAPNYTLSIGENLFGGKLHKLVADDFKDGAGGELKGKIPTISALHSSAALAVNLFQYWVIQNDFESLARILNVPTRDITSGKFEDKFPVCIDPESQGFQKPPHLDFALRYKRRACVGVECKLFEPHGRLDHTPLRKPYLALKEAWEDIPACRALAKKMADGQAGYHRLGVSQLLKHILGMKFYAPTKKVRLIYLYLDAIGDEAAEHRDEIRRFEEAIATDPIRFVPLTVQDFIHRAGRSMRQKHGNYVDYLSERYL